ncbi:receptor like protein 21 [Forsythia ovata]|uniref:Receptor like protein 21 n=1 Tax=Forsythia ovata TaxID=205694 RepID=A0ABD1NYJ7_9LAMI
MVLSFRNEKWYCLGCFEEERIALLYLKENIPIGILLPSWVDYETKAGCCHWQGVQCSNTTGRVIQLDLYNTRYLVLEDWYFNASLFLPFQELRNLSLGYNNLVGWIENEGLSSIQGLSSLESLFLPWNEIKGSVQINELYALNDLVELDLSYNEIENFNTSKDIKTVHSLQVLCLDGIFVSNISNMLQSLRAFPHLKNLYLRRYMKRPIATIYELRHLSQLEGLFLDNSYLDAIFLPSIGVMTSLKFLSLSSCGIGGTLPNQGWCELKNLEALNLSDNEFEGILPSCLGNMTSLQFIELSENNLSHVSTFQNNLT